MKTFKEIQALSNEILAEFPKMKTQEIYTLVQTERVTKHVAFGELSGLNPKVWPKTSCGEAMHFHFLLYLADFPELKKKFPNIEAMAFFSEDEEAWNALLESDEEAFEDYEDGFDVQENKTLFLSQAEFASCKVRGVHYEAVAIEIPISVFGDPNQDYLNPKKDFPEMPEAFQKKLKELNTAIYQLPVRIGGYPIWLQENQGHLGFIMQFDEGFADMNMGDSGVMYLYEHDGFWQCY